MGERSLCSLCWQPTIKACELADQKQLSSQAAENANDDSQPWRHLEKHARALPAAQWSQLQAVYVTVSMWCSLMLQCQQLQMQTHRNAQAPLQTAAWACFVQHVKHTHMQTFRDTIQATLKSASLQAAEDEPLVRCASFCSHPLPT